MSSLVLGLLFPLSTISVPTDNRRASDVLNDIMPGIITIMVVAAWLILTVLGRPTPDLLNAMVQIVVAFFFGQHTAMASARKILADRTPPAPGA